jgi:hypothetical protein
MLLGMIVAVAIGMYEPESLELTNEFEDAQVLARRELESYRNHPAGEDVLDYHICYLMDLRNDHSLFLSRSGIRPSAAQIWDFDPPQLSTLRANPTEDFLILYRVALNTLVFERFGEIGRAGCMELFADHEMSWDEYNALLDAQRDDH